MKNLAQNKPLLTFFLLTFLISWGGVLILAAPYGFPTTQAKFEANYPLVFIPYLLGPLLSCLILIGLTRGKIGFRELWIRITRWQVSIRWYAAALLAAPLLTLVLLLIFSRFSRAYLPAIFTVENPASLLLTGLMIGVFGGGLMEEPGWTGFALPRLRKRFGVFQSGIILGLIWGLWHILPTYWGSGDAAGNLSMDLLLPPLFFYLAVLPPYRMLMVWIYDGTESLLVTMLMHASLTASTLFILAPDVTGKNLLLYYLILAGLLWTIVAAVIQITRRQSS